MEQKENNFIESILPTLRLNFIVQREVWSKCRNGRIDLIISPIGYEHVYFGVECKIPESKRGDEIGAYISQAMRYTKYEFEVSPGVFKIIPILIYPPLSYKYFLMNERTQEINGEFWHKDRHHRLDEHHSFNGFLGHWNVGEMRKANNEPETKRKKDYIIISFSNKVIWSTKPKWDDENRRHKREPWLHEENYNKLLKKINDNNI